MDGVVTAMCRDVSALVFDVLIGTLKCKRAAVQQLRTSSLGSLYTSTEITRYWFLVIFLWEINVSSVCSVRRRADEGS